MLGAGISVTEVSDDFLYGKVKLRMGLLNRNFMGTHFGGSLFAMTDMMYAFMLLRHLGEDHIIWDQSASIRFVKLGRGNVFAEFRLTSDQVNEIRRAVADGEKHLETLLVNVVDSSGDIVAEVERTLYIRRKRSKRQ